jgi:hypothetical protein
VYFYKFYIFICFYNVLFCINNIYSNCCCDNIHIEDTEKNVIYITNELDKDYIAILYRLKGDYSDNVYKDTHWWQSSIIKKEELEDFLSNLEIFSKQYIENNDHRVFAYSIFKGKSNASSKLKEYENKFLNSKFVKYIDKKKAIEDFKSSFFNNNRHTRRKTWQSFFEVINRNFKKENSDEYFFSEGDNDSYTYLYILTENNMYELGFQIENKTLFLIRISLQQDAKHFFVYSQYFDKNIYSFTEKKDNFQMCVDHIWGYDAKNKSHKYKSDDVNEFEKMLCEDIRSSFDGNKITEDRLKSYHKLY